MPTAEKTTQTSPIVLTGEAQLLTLRQARKMRPSPLVYGFEASSAPLKAIADAGLFPIPPGLTGSNLMSAEWQQALKTMDHICKKCAAAAEITEEYVGFLSVIEYGTREEQWILAIGGCRQPRKDLLPQGERMEKLKAVVQSFGITAEPKWYKAMRD